MSDFGCCVDKACTERSCMNLPAGQSCSTCVHERRCVAMFGAKPENTWCDFFPRLFQPKPNREGEKPKGEGNG